MNAHMERMAAELAHMRVMGVGGGGGMSKQMTEQWDNIVGIVQQNNGAIKEGYKSRADQQMQVSALQSEVCTCCQRPANASLGTSMRGVHMLLETSKRKFQHFYQRCEK
jgi:hypothetical protein